MPKGGEGGGKKGKQASLTFLPSSLPLPRVSITPEPFVTAKKALISPPSRGDANSGLKNQRKVRTFRDLLLGKKDEKSQRTLEGGLVPDTITKLFSSSFPHWYKIRG